MAAKRPIARLVTFGDRDRALLRAADACLERGEFGSFGELCKAALADWLLPDDRRNPPRATEPAARYVVGDRQDPWGDRRPVSPDPWDAGEPQAGWEAGNDWDADEANDWDDWEGSGETDERGPRDRRFPAPGRAAAETTLPAVIAQLRALRQRLDRLERSRSTLAPPPVGLDDRLARLEAAIATLQQPRSTAAPTACGSSPKRPAVAADPVVQRLAQLIEEF